ncbi:Crp/Fnr family transcriptional regulator [Prosthecomicrobium sp. N25]|uniref:Crp/Fnr family transcriptional regulator n=1 Tax=Prosthecomicrobium sp. N25 TaxID=3129254 RepID=UPI003078A1E2
MPRNFLLRALSREGREQVLMRCDSVSLSQGDLLGDAGQPMSHVYFVESGILSVLFQLPDRELEVGICGREGFTGVPVVLGAAQTPFQIIVQSPAATVLRISSDVLRAALGPREEDMTVLRRYCFAFLTQVAANARAAACFTLEQRLARWILMAHDRTDGDVIHLSHQFLAEMLGVRRAGVTVATHVLEGSGYISASRMTIQVRNRDGLLGVAGSSYGLAEAEYERLIGCAPRLAA